MHSTRRLGTLTIKYVMIIMQFNADFKKNNVNILAEYSRYIGLYFSVD